MEQQTDTELVMDDILRRAGKEKASDVLITHGAPPILYVSGNMLKYKTPSLSPEQTRALICSCLDEKQIMQLETDRELDFSYNLGDWRFRGNAFFQRDTIGAVLRLIPSKVPQLDTLGLPAHIHELMDLPQGLILLTGPTGHGKSTTLAAMIDYANHNHACHIITIEDPIEYTHQNKRSIIEQRELGSDTLSFARAVRQSLRQAPHIILVGEMRDFETAAAVLTAAETGHLVLATLHTNDAKQSIDRILDIFPPQQQPQARIQLSMVLEAIISQRLLPGTDEGERVLACEFMRRTPAISNLIRLGKTHQIDSVIETSSKHGMHSLDSSIKELYLHGEISEETAKKYLINPGSLFG